MIRFVTAVLAASVLVAALTAALFLLAGLPVSCTVECGAPSPWVWV